MEYTYTKTDLFFRPNSYMYPPFGGEGFLESWEKQRLDFLSKIAPLCATSCLHAEVWDKLEQVVAAPTRERFQSAMTGIFPADAKQRDADFAWPETEDVLAVWASAPRQTYAERVQTIFNALVQRFEISKKLPARIILPRAPLNNAPLLSCEAYCFFAQILAFRCSERLRLTELNCLLKLNDLISSQDLSQPSMTSLTPRHYAAIAIGLFGELIATALVFQQKGQLDGSA